MMFLSATRCDNLFIDRVSFKKSYLRKQKEELEFEPLHFLPYPPKFVLYKYPLKSLLRATLNGFSTFGELLSGFISEKFAQLEEKKYSWGIP